MNLRGQQLLSLRTVEEGRRKLLQSAGGNGFLTALWYALESQVGAQSTLDEVWEAEVTVLVPKILSFVPVVDSTS